MIFVWNEATESYDLKDIRSNDLQLISTALFSAQLEQLAKGMNFADQPEDADRASRRAKVFQDLDTFITHPDSGEEFILEEDIGVD